MPWNTCTDDAVCLLNGSLYRLEEQKLRAFRKKNIGT